MQEILTHPQGGIAGDLVALLTVVIPHVVVVLVAGFNFFKSRNNGQRLRRIERALNGKVDYPQELYGGVDRRKKKE